MSYKSTSLLSNFLIIFLIAFSLPVVKAGGLKLTPLDHYVRAPDPNYNYSVAETITGEFEGTGYKTYMVNMVSQKWLTEKDFSDVPL